jgi:hypothetical protein
VNPDLVVDGLIINGVLPTTGEHAAWVDEYRRSFGAAVLRAPGRGADRDRRGAARQDAARVLPARGAAVRANWFRRSHAVGERTGWSAPRAADPQPLGGARGA